MTKTLINIATGKRIKLPTEAELEVSGSFYCFSMSWGDFRVLDDSRNADNLRSKLAECLVSEGVAEYKEL